MDPRRSFHQDSEQDPYDAFFRDPDGDVYTLGAPGLEPQDMADDASFRRDSMNSAALSPLSGPKWEDHEQQPLQVELGRRTSFTSSDPFGDEHHRRSFATANRPSSVMHRSTAWHPLNSASGTVSPQALGQYSTSGDHEEYLGSAGLPTHPMSVPAGFVPFDQIATDGQSNHTSTSPYSNSDQMGMVEQEYSGRNALPRHPRAGGRHSRFAPTRSNPDGVRKKNTRIDIPADRNLNTIEEMIERANDEDELRELKAQRRLLRNREAALASRQRKKQHTEDLEVREQSYTKQINMLTAEITDLRHIHGSMNNELNDLREKHANAIHVINAHDLEKEELSLKYTQENGILRRKLAFLQQQLNHVHDHDFTTPSNTNFNDFASDLSALSVNQQDWMSGNDNPFNDEPQQTQPATAHQDMKSIKGEPDTQIASGVLFMILLCGAFVASKGGSKPLLPRLPDEVRVASHTILETLLREPRADSLTGNMQPPNMAGLQHQEQMQNMLQPHDPWQQHGSAQDPRQNLYRSLTMPSGQQEAEQMFQITPSEYNGMTSTDTYPMYHPHQTLTPRRNLAGSLAHARSESIAKGSAAECYTRSLMWDNIPNGIVRQFRELIMISDMSE